MYCNLKIVLLERCDYNWLQENYSLVWVKGRFKVGFGQKKSLNLTYLKKEKFKFEFKLSFKLYLILK